MRRKTRVSLAIVTIAVAILIADLRWGPHARLGPGRRLPELELSAPRGDTVDSSGFRGKVLLLDFFASW
jgi:hypothetical protein